MNIFLHSQDIEVFVISCFVQSREFEFSSMYDDVLFQPGIENTAEAFPRKVA